MADPLRLLVPAGHPLAGRPAASLAEVAGERWIHGWGDVGDATDMLAALSGFRPQVACRSSDYRFMSALVGAGVGVALVPSLALTGSPEVRALQITPQLIRYIGAWLLHALSNLTSPRLPGSKSGGTPALPKRACHPYAYLCINWNTHSCFLELHGHPK